MLASGNCLPARNICYACSHMVYLIQACGLIKRAFAKLQMASQQSAPCWSGYCVRQSKSMAVYEDTPVPLSIHFFPRTFLHLSSHHCHTHRQVYLPFSPSTRHVCDMSRPLHLSNRELEGCHSWQLDKLENLCALYIASSSSTFT